MTTITRQPCSFIFCSRNKKVEQVTERRKKNIIFMATEEKKQESVILKEPLRVIEVPEKKIIAVEQEQSESKVASSEKGIEDEEKEMDISMEINDDVITPSNQT
jgi:hypothetical protein